MGRPLLAVALPGCWVTVRGGQVPEQLLRQAVWARGALSEAGEVSPSALPCPPARTARAIRGRGREGKVKARLRRGVGGWRLERCRRGRGSHRAGPGRFSAGREGGAE